MAAKKKPAKKRTAKKSTENSAVSAVSARRQLRAIILFGVSVFLLFVVLVDGPNFWGWIHDFFLGIFGICAYFLPFILGYIAVMNTLDKPMGKMVNKIMESAFLVILIGAAIDVFTADKLGKFFDHAKDAYIAGSVKSGGGLLGSVLGYPLSYLLGKFGAAVVLIILIFVFLMLITGTTLISLFRTLTKPVKETARSAQEIIERRAAEQEERRAKFNIDVPVDGDISTPPPETSLDDKKSKLISSYHGEPAPEPAPTPEEPEEKTADALAETSTPSEEAVSAEEESTVAVKKKEKAKKASEFEADFKSEPYADGAYHYPPLSLLDMPKLDLSADGAGDLQQNAAKLVDTLKSFGVETRVIHISKGPSVTRYELQPSAGVKISKITNLADDIALNLATAGVRIEAPIPNKPAVGIEVPNKLTSIVYMREVLESAAFKNAKSRLSMALGKDIAGNQTVADIAKMPHMLIAGATGSGKSVCINSIIISLLFKAKPEEVKLLMIDPKVVELGIYNGIPHLITPVVTDPRKAAGALGWAVTEMLKRYKLFAENGVRDIFTYNTAAEKSDTLQKMPQIVIIIDELADLMMAAPNEVEDSICRLAQMARAAGMHLIIATQRPSVDVITGIIKANIPSRVAFMVSSQVDSRTILDMGGAEKLLGKGDMLFSPVGSVKPSRIQGCWVSEREVDAVVSFIKNSQEHNYDETVGEEIERLAVQEKAPKSSAGGTDPGDSDEMLPQAIEVVVEAGLASTSLLQRRLKLGYARAARIIDQMEEQGIVGPFEGSKPRQVLMSKQQWLERQNQT